MPDIERRPGRRSGSRLRPIASMEGSACACSMSRWPWPGPASSPPVVPATAQTPGPIIVVPFTNVSRQPADDWIGAGLAETIAADLRNAGLDVVGRRAGDAADALLSGDGDGDRNGNGNGNGWYDGGALDAYLRRGVAWLVDGTLQRVGERLRITTRIVEVATGATAFGTRVDGDFGDLFDIQDEVGAALAGHLSGGSRTRGRGGGRHRAASRQRAVRIRCAPRADRVGCAGPHRPGRARAAARRSRPESSSGGAAGRNRCARVRRSGGRPRRRPAPRAGAPAGGRLHADAANAPDGGHRAHEQSARASTAGSTIRCGKRPPMSPSSSRSRRWRARRARRRPRCGWRTTTTISTSRSTPTTRGPR